MNLLTIRQENPRHRHEKTDYTDSPASPDKRANAPCSCMQLTHSRFRYNTKPFQELARENRM